jgi:hypothetical protein
VSNLYELTSDLAQLKNIDEMEDAKDIIAVINTQIENKSYGLIKVDREYESDIKAIEKEIEWLTDKKRTLKNNREKFRQHILFCMNYADLKKLETPIGNITVRKGGVGSLKIDNAESVPEKYKTKIEKIEIDNKALKEDIKNGQVIQGVYIEATKPSLMIK